MTRSAAFEILADLCGLLAGVFTLAALLQGRAEDKALPAGATS